MSSIRILLADDHSLFRRGLRQICEIQGGFEVVGEAADGEEAVQLTDDLKPDVILMDVNIPKLNSIQATSQILHTHPETRILILTKNRKNQFVSDAIKAGAKGYLKKNADALELLEAVRRAYRDEPLITSQLSARETSDFRRQGIYVLGDSRSFLDSLLGIPTEAIICVNVAQEILLFSTGAEAIFGYVGEEVIGQPLNMLIPESFHEVHLEHVHGFIASGDSSRFMHQRRSVYGQRKNGEVFPALASIARHNTPDGRILAVILSDISEQTQLEERLLKLSVVVEQTPAMVVVTDTHGRIEYVNPAFEKVSGYTYDEVIGANPRIIKSGLMPIEVYQDMWGTITAGDVWRGELCNRKKNGDLYWDLGTVSPIRNKEGIITNYISVKEDITERKKNEEELQHYRQQLEALVEARTAELREEISERKRTEEVLREKERRLAEAQRIGKLGSWEWNVQNNELIWSDESYRIFGVNPMEFVLNYQNALDLVHPDDREILEKASDATLLEGQPLNIDHKVVLLDGRQRMINLNAAPMYDDHGNISKLIGTVQDITDRIRVEKELLEKESLTKELDIGRDIQLSMLPKACPSVEGWQFVVYYQPASQVGGDFYDFIYLPDGQIGLVIADAAGKGVPAALMMSLSRVILKTIALNGSGPSSTLLHSNQILYKEYSESAFVSAFYASIDPKNGRMEFANAGHNRPLWYSSRSGESIEIYSKGIVLGLFPEVSIDQETIEIMPGDVLVFYTDGLIEAQNEQNDFYETSRLVEIFSSNTHKNAMEILDAIVHSWKNFVGNSPQSDDLTLIVVRRTIP